MKLQGSRQFHMFCTTVLLTSIPFVKRRTEAARSNRQKNDAGKMPNKREKIEKQEMVQLSVLSGAINHRRFSTDRHSADAAVESRSPVYMNFWIVLVEYDHITHP